jgi:uncharacterized coiled-coil protein SlyX
MKTAKEMIDAEYNKATKNGSYSSNHDVYFSDKTIEELMKAYAEQACDKQKEVYKKIKELKSLSDKLGSKQPLVMGGVYIPAGGGFGDGYKCAIHEIFKLLEPDPQNLSELDEADKTFKPLRTHE